MKKGMPLYERDDALSFFRDGLRLERSDSELFALLFAPVVTAQQVADLFTRLDVEALPLEKVSLLLHLCLKTSFAGVPEREVPRIRGVSRFLLLHNAKLIMNMVVLAKEFAQAGIPLLLCKGIAMRLHYLPGQSRHMWDVDAAVSPESFDQAVRIAEAAGCDTIFSRHAATLFRSYGSVDLHHVFYKSSIKGVDERGVWERSREITAHGCTFRVPCPEDMLLQILTNEFSNLVTEQRQRAHVKWIYDAGCLLGASAVDWERLYAIAEECRVAGMANIMLALLRESIPDVLEASGMPEASLDVKITEKMAAYYTRSLKGIHRYQEAKKSRKIYRYAWYWLSFTWHYHNYYLYGLSFRQRLGLFPANCKALFNIRSWREFPLAALNKLRTRINFDRGIR